MEHGTLQTLQISTLIVLQQWIYYWIIVESTVQEFLNKKKFAKGRTHAESLSPDDSSWQQDATSFSHCETSHTNL